MGDLPTGVELWLEGLLREQVFWQVVTILALLALLVILGPHLGLGLTSEALN